MSEQSITMVFDLIPQFVFGIVLYYMCYSSHQKDAEILKDIIDDYRKMLSMVIKQGSPK